MTPQFSIIHATFGRPHKAVAAMARWLERAAKPEQVEYIFAVNEDDDTGSELVRWSLGLPVRFAVGAYRGSAEAWDYGAKSSTGQILIQASDDVLPPDAWDVELMHHINLSGHLFDWMNQSIFIATGNGYRKDGLVTSAIMTRKRYDQRGHFVCPEYISMWSDDDATYAALRDARDGKCILINARDLIFRHEHFCHNPAVPFDTTYARTGSPEAYEHGVRLFARRNPEAATDGLRTWV